MRLDGRKYDNERNYTYLLTSVNFVQSEHTHLPIIIELYKSSDANLGSLRKRSEKIRNRTETNLFDPAPTNSGVGPEPFVVVANEFGQAPSGQNHDFVSLLRKTKG